MEDSEQIINSPEPAPPPYERRSRRALIFAVCAAFFWLAAGFVNCYVLHRNGYSQLNSSLGQTVTAFSHALNSRNELLSGQAAALAKDARWQQPIPKVWEPDNVAAAAENERIQNFLQEALLTTDANVLLLLNDKRQVVGSAERQLHSPLLENLTATEAAVSAEEKSEADKPVAVLPEMGTLLEQPAVLSAFEFAESRSGYLCLKSDSAVINAVVVPLLDGKTVKGAFLLGEIVSDKLLSDCSQGMMEGVLAVVADHKVMAAFDKRTARRPAPLLLTSLEDMAEKWQPANTTQKITLKEGEANASPERMEIAGRPWCLLSMELSSGGKAPVGWVLFLADTSSVEDTVRYNGWFFIIAVVVFLPFAYFLAWRL